MPKEIEYYALKHNLVLLMATISPDNKVSKNNFELMQYTKVQEIISYNGLHRIVLGKKILKNNPSLLMEP